MDAPEVDQDVALHRVSADLIADLDRSLPLLLRRDAGSRSARLPAQVRARETSRLTGALLDPFQELPQLLDPHLARWLPLLADAYLESQRQQQQGRPRWRRLPRLSARPPGAPLTQRRLLEPLPAALCRILYTFCKVRGEKVVVRFLSAEPRHIEVLLSALERSIRVEARIREKKIREAARIRERGWKEEGDEEEEDDDYDNDGMEMAWTWQQRYIVLLWLSHLLLAPFDLSTISSVELDDDDDNGGGGGCAPAKFAWPADLPGVAARVIPLAIRSLDCPGRERDAARALLVRLAARRDMQEIGVPDALVGWAITSLRPSRDTTSETPYFYVGVLSLLAGVLEWARDVGEIIHAVQEAETGGGGGSTTATAAKPVASSALARKATIKVLRRAVEILLRHPGRDGSASTAAATVESVIGHLLGRTSDTDTPVRFAAAKALSVITLRLDPDMAAQVVEAVLDGLGQNVLRPEVETDGARDLSGVDALEWHGLTLTLAHLLYRRSPPAAVLPAVIRALLLGLAFERRGPSSGASVGGANVRDAACFGIWALARRYSTAELLAVDLESCESSSSPCSPSSPSSSLPSCPPSVLQVLATALIVSACLDPAGNIRRGASAALQELVGRHPDTVELGILAVQTVDYHAVALRARAVGSVAPAAAAVLPSVYGEALLRGLLGWRGVGDPDPTVRRAVGRAFGAVVAVSDNFDGAVAVLAGRRSLLKSRQVEELHGIMLCLAAVLDQPSIARRGPHREKALAEMASILENCDATKYRRPELVAEGAARLVVSAATPFLNQQQGVNDALDPDSNPDPDAAPAIISRIATLLESVIPSWLVAVDSKHTVAAVSQAAHLLLLLLPTAAAQVRVLEGWAAAVRRVGAGYGTAGHGSGYFFALAAAHPVAITIPPERDGRSADDDLVCDALKARWALDRTVETRVAILQAVTGSAVLKARPRVFLELLREALGDYTVTARGDVGSHVRLEAVRAARSLWGEALDPRDVETAKSTLFLNVLRIAAEKLDRVRTEAHSALGLALPPASRSALAALSASSSAYFLTLLDLASAAAAADSGSDAPLSGQLRSHRTATATAAATGTEELLAGLAVSADGGSEDLVTAAREALCSFCQRGRPELIAVCSGLVTNLRQMRVRGDRVVAPTLEVIAFLLRVGVMGKMWEETDGPDPQGILSPKGVCILVQKAAFKSKNVRKLEACVRVYGGIASLSPAPAREEEDMREGVREARRRLGALLGHPFPKIRTLAADALWVVLAGEADEEGKGRDVLRGVDWGRASREAVQEAVRAMGVA